MYNLVLIFHVIVSIALVALVLLQQGKGAEAGAGFAGGSASQSVFGSSGSGSFITRATAIAATFFFITSISLTKLALVNRGSVESTLSKTAQTIEANINKSSTSKTDQQHKEIK